MTHKRKSSSNNALDDRAKMKKTMHYPFLLVVLLIVPLLFQCTKRPDGPVYTRDGKIYGKVRGAFRHRWWNYYERALSFAEGEFYQEAVKDLKEAVGQREKDQRMARTYGMHFIDYFPHRELGIVYHQMGDLGAAKRELEVSLSHFPSAKAHFYLDRVRKNLIEQEGKEVTPPRLTLAFKEDEFWTRQDPVAISGVAEDEHYISGITINKVPLFLEVSQKRIPFEETLPLFQGRHTIEVVAKNLLGKVTRHQIIIHVDREGPVITLEEVKFDRSTSGREVTICGSVYDRAGVSELSIDGQSIPIQEGVEVFFTKRLPIDKGDLELVAQDRLGNQTSARIPLTASSDQISEKQAKYPAKSPFKKSKIHNPQSKIQNPWPRPQGGTHQGRPQSKIQNPKSKIYSPSHRPVMVACDDSDGGGLFVAGLFGSRDTRPPSIRLRGWTDLQTVFLEKVYIEGEIRDESKIEGLTINQIPILRRRGKSIFFSHLADLKEGENTITIETRDEAGNTATKRISVIRRVPKALQLQERLSLTVFPFEQKGTVSEASLSFQDNLIGALVNQNRFQMVERDRLDLILQEQKLSRSKLIDKSTALKLGRLIAAHTIITGSIIETRTGIEIVGRMIDTETSEILATEDVYDEIKDLPALRILAEGMAIKFHREFPLLEGLVIQQKGNYIFTDLGQDEIKIQRRLIVYREEPIKHPVTGKTLGADNVIIGNARVIQVMPEMSKAEIVIGKISSIKRLDKVITE